MLTSTNAKVESTHAHKTPLVRTPKALLHALVIRVMLEMAKAAWISTNAPQTMICAAIMPLARTVSVATPALVTRDIVETDANAQMSMSA